MSAMISGTIPLMVNSGSPSGSRRETASAAPPAAAVRTSGRRSWTVDRPPARSRPPEGDQQPHQHEHGDHRHDHHRGRRRGHHQVAGVPVAGLRAGVDRLDVRERAQRVAQQPQDHRAHDRHGRRRPDQQPRPPRRPVPDLGDEVAEGQDHERQARVVVVLEGGAVDAGPRDPLGQERDQDQREGEAAAPVGLVGHERHRRDAQPPDHHVAGVVDGGRGGVRVGALVEPDGLEVERPGPPGRAGGVGRGQVVVVLVHPPGELHERLARVCRRASRRRAGGSRSAPTARTRAT